MRNNTLLKKWLNANGMMKPNGLPATHLLLDGGTVYMPEERAQDFLRMYTEILQPHTEKPENACMYVVETRTPMFAMVADLDFVFPDPSSPEAMADADREAYVARVITLACSIVREFYPAATLDAHAARTIVCTTKHKRRDIDQVPHQKYGVHLIWPELVVRREEAVLLRHAIVHRVTQVERIPQPAAAWDWDNVVDEVIYTANGIRMVGSDKVSPCGACKADRSLGVNCPDCRGDRRVCEGRVYMPARVITGDLEDSPAELARMRADVHYMTTVCSLRRPAAEAPTRITIPSWYFPPAAPMKFTKTPRTGAVTKGGARVLVLKDEARVRDILPCTDPIHKTIAGFLATSAFFSRDATVGVIQRCQPNGSTRGKGAHWYDIKTDSRRCGNLAGREHNNCTVYYRMTRSHVVQKCFCKCPTTAGRATGDVCSKYEGPKTSLPEYVARVCFPDWCPSGKRRASLPNVSLSPGHQPAVGARDSGRATATLASIDDFVLRRRASLSTSLGSLKRSASDAGIGCDGGDDGSGSGECGKRACGDGGEC